MQIEPTSKPISYDQQTRQFEIYSEDYSLIGTKSIMIEAFLQEYLTT